MKLEVKDNLESAYGLARVLVLYARDKSYADRLADRKFLKIYSSWLEQMLRGKLSLKH